MDSGVNIMRLFLIVEADSNVTTIDELADAYQSSRAGIFVTTEKDLSDDYSDGALVFEIKKLKEVEMIKTVKTEKRLITGWVPACD